MSQLHTETPDFYHNLSKKKGKIFSFSNDRETWVNKTLKEIKCTSELLFITTEDKTFKYMVSI